MLQPLRGPALKRPYSGSGRIRPEKAFFGHWSPLEPVRGGLDDRYGRRCARLVTMRAQARKGATARMAASAARKEPAQGQLFTKCRTVRRPERARCPGTDM
jgi:hypothetical protein